jgi:hypothetical protein
MRGLTTAAALASLGLVGCGGGDSTPTTAAPATPKNLRGAMPDTVITIRASARVIDLGTPLIIDGTVRRDGRVAANLRVRLLKHDNRTPAGALDQVGSTRTRHDGSYRFVVRPDRNADWSVQTDLAESSAHGAVAVSLPVRLVPETKGGVRSLVYTAFGPPDAKPRHARALLYVAPPGSHEYTLFGAAPLRPTPSRLSVATARFTPAPPSSLQTMACVHGVIAHGWGKFQPPCGGRHLTYVRPTP